MTPRLSPEQATKHPRTHPGMSPGLSPGGSPWGPPRRALRPLDLSISKNKIFGGQLWGSYEDYLGWAASGRPKQIMVGAALGRPHPGMSPGLSLGGSLRGPPRRALRPLELSISKNKTVGGQLWGSYEDDLGWAASGRPKQIIVGGGPWQPPTTILVGQKIGFGSEFILSTVYARVIIHIQSGCTERSAHTCARVPADLAQDSKLQMKAGRLGEGRGWFLYGFT